MMYITDPKEPITPAFYYAKESASCEGLCDANSRYTYFEAIREVGDPLELRQSTPTKALRNEDYILDAPKENPYLLAQIRLATLKNRIQEQTLQHEKEIEIKAKNERFIAGLMSF